MVTAWVLTVMFASPISSGTTPHEALHIKVASGELVGVLNPETGVQSFKGIPFAAPPVGEFRWREPQPVQPWAGVRQATKFGDRPMQLPVFGDMRSQSDTMSEDCLTLNVWTPEKRRPGLPVLVYFYGGGFVAGDAAEGRYDGESMAQKGIVAVTVNYRLGVFGFMAHPELTQESPFHASGNYGLLDQSAGLKWVHDNIAAFGGDPKKVTIAGESAGSFSVSAQMASPLSRDLIAGAIGESGAMFGEGLSSGDLGRAEKLGADFAKAVKANSLASLRAIPAQKLLELTRTNPFRFGVTIDGHFLPKSVESIFTAGEQAHVPLLAGWNSEEGNAGSILANKEPSPENFEIAIRRLYGTHADDLLKALPHATPTEVKQSATDLAGDRFIGFGTWKWTDAHSKTGGSPIYRYLFTKARPGETGAFHSVEIEYAMGNLHKNAQYKWQEADRKVSETMMGYFANFIKTGNPNGKGLPKWPVINGKGTGSVMQIGEITKAAPDTTRERYQALDRARS